MVTCQAQFYTAPMTVAQLLCRRSDRPLQCSSKQQQRSETRLRVQALGGEGIAHNWMDFALVHGAATFLKGLAPVLRRVPTRQY